LQSKVTESIQSSEKAVEQQISKIIGEVKASEQKLTNLFLQQEQKITQFHQQLSSTAGKTPEMAKLLDQIKNSVDALWSSLGVISGRIVEVEAHIDMNR
jgi:hypothetical protein